MGPVHVPRQPRTRSRSARARRGHRRLTALAIAILAALTMMAGAQRAAFAATGATGATARAAAAADGPYGGTAAAVPGTVQAANYDTGGQGVAYNVTSANGSANSYRSDGVDLETTADTQDTSPAGGAYDLGWTTAGQWFKYTVNVATAGTYSVAFRVASPVRDHRRAAHRQLLRHQPDRLGRHPEHRRLRDLDHGRRQRHAAGRPADAHPRPGLQRLELPRHGLHPQLGRRRLGGPGNDQPFGGTPAPVPGTVQVANYDTGGQGVAYSVSSTNGSANSYRSDGVDLENTADTQDTSAAGGAYDMGWTTPGQYFNYTVEVATAGIYTVSFRVASPYGITDALHIANSAGTNLTGSVAIPNTGGYETWATVTASVTLPAGTQTLTVDQDSNGWNFHYFAFTQGSSGGGGGTGGTGPTEYCGTQDLALDQPTTASSTQDATDYPAADATDGDPGPRWSSAASDPQWLEVDLGSQQQICSLGLLWEAAYASAFQLQVSNDNSTWTTVYSTTTGAGGSETFPVSVTDRYIRMYGTARATQFGYSIFEFDVYGLTTTAAGHRRQRQRR